MSDEFVDVMLGQFSARNSDQEVVQVPAPATRTEMAVTRQPPRVKDHPVHDQFSSCATPDLAGYRAELREAFGDTMSYEFVDVMSGKVIEALKPSPFDHTDSIQRAIWPDVLRAAVDWLMNKIWRQFRCGLSSEHGLLTHQSSSSSPHQTKVAWRAAHLRPSIRQIRHCTSLQPPSSQFAYHGHDITRPHTSLRCAHTSAEALGWIRNQASKPIAVAPPSAAIIPQ